MALSTIPFSGLGADASKQGINFRNLIINGDMSIHQRGSAVTSTNGFGVDRFQYNDSNNYDQRVFTFNQDTDVPTGQGFGKSMKINVTTPETTIASDEYARVFTRLEGQNLQQLKFGTSSAESVTLSFWLKTNVTGNFAVSLLLDDDSRIIGNTYSATSSGVWEKITITFAGDTTGVIDNDNGSGMRVMFITDAGSNFTSSDNTSWGSYSNAKLGYGQTASVFGTTSGYWNVTGVQLEADTSASDFEFLPYDVNLMRCQRYYYERVAEDAYGPGVQGMQIGASDTMIQGYHPIKMRAAPSMSVSGTWVMEVGTTSVAWTCPSTRTSTTAFSSQQSAGNSDGSAAIVYSNNNTASAIIGDAEL